MIALGLGPGDPERGDGLVQLEPPLVEAQEAVTVARQRARGAARTLRGGLGSDVDPGRAVDRERLAHGLALDGAPSERDHARLRAVEPLQDELTLALAAPRPALEP